MLAIERKAVNLLDKKYEREVEAPPPIPSDPTNDSSFCDRAIGDVSAESGLQLRPQACVRDAYRLGGVRGPDRPDGLNTLDGRIGRDRERLEPNEHHAA